MPTITIAAGQSTTVAATHGQMLEWEASAAGYSTQTGSSEITENKTVPIHLSSSETVNIPVVVRFLQSGIHGPVDFYWKLSDAGGAYQHISVYEDITSYLNDVPTGRTVQWYAEYSGTQVGSGSYPVRSGLQAGIIININE